MCWFHTKREGANQATNEICPKIQKKLERSKDLQRYYICRWQDGVVFEVDHYHDSRRVVNLSNMACSCGRWQLNGILCSHACVGTQDDHTIISVDIPTLEHVNIRKDTLLPVEKVAGQELLLLTKGYNGTL
jgi:hypothetical protein